MRNARRLVPLALVVILAACGENRDSKDASAIQNDLVPYERVTLRDSRCDGCTLVLDSLAVIGSAEGPAIIESEFTSVTRDRRGRYYVNGGYATSLKVFSDDDTFLTTVGNEGAGPGEFAGIASVHIGAGDTLYVLDNSNRRLTVLSPSYEYISSSALEVPPQKDGSLRLDDGRFVLASSVGTATLAGLPLHLIDPSGAWIQGFGALPAEFDRTGSEIRLIAQADATGVWSAAADRYRIEQWEITPNGNRLTKVLERQAEWFPSDNESSRTLADPPQTSIGGIQADGEGRLLVIGLVPGESWQDAVTAGGSHRMVNSWETYYDSVLELLDPATGEVLASTRFPHLLRFVDENVVSAVVDDPNGVPYVHVWRVRLQK